MQKLVIKILAGMMVIQVQAATLDNCGSDLQAADALIKKQNELIDLHVSRVQELNVESERLNKALQDLKSIDENAVSNQITYGIVGIAVGVVLTTLVMGHK